MARERAVVEHLLEEAGDLRAGGVADEVHGVGLVPERVVAARVGPPEPGVAARRAVRLAVVHAPALEVVEELPGPVVDAGERAQVRHQHAAVFVLRAGEVREPSQPLRRRDL